VLDVGCATGALLATFAEAGWDCLGLDACAPAVEYGRRRFGLDLRPTTLEDAGIGDERFDLVHASHLIEHLNEPLDFLRTVSGLVAPGGYFVITTPNIAGFQARLLGGAWRSAIYDHLCLFSIRTMRRMVEEVGAKVLHMVTWGGWAAGLRPAFIKRPLDALAKRAGLGDVTALLCGKGER
jgi:2-polyprenyl-3-methyl-5-hydroxy-6-metoxy-1,4-benzoquinol methylase